MSNHFENKRIIVTGASKGLGAVCARALAAEGARLVLLARSGENLEAVRQSCQRPEEHLSVAADLTVVMQLHEAVARAEKFLGEVDVVLHIAGGGLGLREPLLKAEDFTKLFRLNVGVAAEINHILAPKMMVRRSGNLVHVCSIASNEATGSVGYNAVKAALAGYVRTLGRQLVESGVVVTGILPGGFYAPGNSFARMEQMNPVGLENFVATRLPRKKLGKAEEIVPLLMFLCSDQASMMGGCLVPIDAGEGLGFFVA